MQLNETICGNYRIVNTKRSIPDGIDDANERRLYVFSQVLDEIKPDIVNVHGVGVFARMCLEKCKEKKVPCVYTDHLYVGRKREFEKYEETFEWDDAILSIPDLNIIAVSTGTRNKILNDYPQINPRKIRAILNGTDFVAERKSSNLVSKYDLKGFRVLACVGTLLDRKNQLQVVRAFQYLSSDIRDKVKIIFCGKDRLGGQFQKAVTEAHLEDQLIYVGTFSNEEMKELYSSVDGMILPSYSEGLSIAMLEAIAYGLPVIMYSDSECANDLNDDEICSFAENRSDQALAKAIERWCVKNWNKDHIRKYSTKFSMDRVADEYIAYYTKIINDFKENTND
jgi:glycosyltransferase involved in cell wall biosynthesis